jgi:hypothetical protein
MAWIRSHEGVSNNLIMDVDLDVNGLGRLVAVGGGTAPTRDSAGSGSSELCGLTALKHSFQCGFLLRHRSDVVNSF